jgi:hypothetical protein
MRRYTLMRTVSRGAASFTRTIATLHPGDPAYPIAAVQWSLWKDPASFFTAGGDTVGPSLAILGQPGILAQRTLGLLCSVRCPGHLILATYDFAKKTPRDGAAIIGGFHSPMERTCLDTLLARHVAVIYCPGRRLTQRGFPRAWDPAFSEGRLAALSPFAESLRHVTRDIAGQRNLFVAALATALFVPFAVSGGKTEAVVRISLQQGKDVYTLRDPENQPLIELGARGVSVEELLAVANKTGRSV